MVEVKRRCRSIFQVWMGGLHWRNQANLLRPCRYHPTSSSHSIKKPPSRSRRFFHIEQKSLLGFWTTSAAAAAPTTTAPVAIPVAISGRENPATGRSRTCAPHAPRTQARWDSPSGRRASTRRSEVEEAGNAGGLLGAPLRLGVGRGHGRPDEGFRGRARVPRRRSELGAGWTGQPGPLTANCPPGPYVTGTVFLYTTPDRVASLLFSGSFGPGLFGLQVGHQLWASWADVRERFEHQLWASGVDATPLGSTFVTRNVLEIGGKGHAVDQRNRITFIPPNRVTPYQRPFLGFLKSRGHHQ